jgi:hypothetical protein
MKVERMPPAWPARTFSISPAWKQLQKLLSYTQKLWMRVKRKAAYLPG